MSNSNSIEAQPQHAVVLPCEPEHFNEFIAGLLGKPQTIGRVIDGPFEINKDDVSNLHQLINQRIISQNKGSLIEFTARISYDDGSSVLLNSLEDFLAYAEIRPLVSNQLTLSWTFIIYFITKDVPEKQTIDIVFQADLSSMRVRFVEVSMGSAFSFAGSIFVSIKHTDRSWGSDIDSLLNGHLKLLIKPESRVKIFTQKNSGKVALTTVLIFLVFVSIGIINTARFIQNNYSDQLLSIKKLPESDLYPRVDFIINQLLVGTWTKFGLYSSMLFVVSIILSVIIGVFVTSIGDRGKPSFVLLTKGAEDQKKFRLEKLERNWLTLIGSIIGTVLLGIVANLAFKALMTALAW